MNVITKLPDQIGADIREKLPHRTFTIENGYGGYLKENVKILRVIITQEELRDVIRIIEKVDAHTFYYFNDVEGVSKKYFISPIR